MKGGGLKTNRIIHCDGTFTDLDDPNGEFDANAIAGEELDKETLNKWVGEDGRTRRQLKAVHHTAARRPPRDIRPHVLLPDDRRRVLCPDGHPPFRSQSVPPRVPLIPRLQLSAASRRRQSP